MSIIDELRKAIEASSKSRYRLAKETGVDKGSLSRFVRGQAGLSCPALDAVAAALDLELQPRRPTRPKPKTTKRKRSSKPRR